MDTDEKTCGTCKHGILHGQDCAKCEDGAERILAANLLDFIN